MKKLILIFSVCMTVIFFSRIYGQPSDFVDAKVYLVDRYMHCLIPITHKIPDASHAAQAESILKILSDFESDSNLISMFPKDYERVKVSFKDEILHLDIPESLAEIAPKDRDNQRLFIYQLVNSLCSVSDIKYVRITVDGKDSGGFFDFFKGYEIFSPDYDI